MKKTLMLFLTFMLIFSLGQSAWAFSDIQADRHANKINALKEAGIFQGDGKGKFNPKGKMSYAAGITAIVNGLELSLAKYTFNKAPKASDYFTHVKDGSWYSEAFIIAHINGLDIPKNVKPGQLLTREEFAHYLLQAIEATGDYGYTKMFFHIEDETEFTEGYAGSVQTLLNARFDLLDNNGKFYPKTHITRSDAAGWLYDAMQFVQKAKEIPELEPSPLFDLTLEQKALNSAVKEVIVSAQAPHPGYGIRIASIVFEGDQAIIYTEPILPDEDKAYPQVITEVKASTFISAAYKPVLAADASIKLAER